MPRHFAALCTLLALAGVSGLASQADRDQKNRPISKVVTLLKDMLTQLQKEVDEDENAYEELGCWCKTNQKGKTQAIADGEKRVMVLTSNIDKLAASSVKLSQEVANLEAEVAKRQEALDTATALREKQLAEFTAEEKDMMASIASVGSAVTTLSKHHAGALLQMTDSEEISVLTEIRHLVRRHRNMLAQVVSPRQQRMMEAFARRSGGYFDEPASFGGLQQGATYNPEYTLQGGEIFGVLKQMKETFEANLAKAQEEEVQNNRAYEDMKAAKQSEIKAGSESAEKKRVVLAETGEKHAQASEDLVSTEATLAADKEYLRNVKKHCANIDKEYEERKTTRIQEIEACSKCMALLTSDEATDLFSNSLGLVQQPKLLQLRTQDRRAKVAAKLKEVGTSLHDPRLITLAARVRIDAFTKVKESLQALIGKELQEKEDDIKQKDYCIESFNQNARNTETREREKADSIAKIEDHVNAIEAHTVSIKHDEEAIAEMRRQLKKLSEDREKANAAFQMTVADQKATQKLLSAALGVLKGFYEKPSLVQTARATIYEEPAGPPPPQGFKKYEKSAASGGVLNMIQHIIDDAKAMEAEALQSETQAQQAYEDAVADTNAAVKAKQEDIVEKTAARAKEAEDKVSEEITRDQKIADIESLQKENVDLHYSCDYMLKNFDLRMEARDEEVEALKQGLATFSGATFTAFLQGRA